MQTNNVEDILLYAKKNAASFEKGGVSSNQIHIFTFGGKKYILKTPLMVGDNLSSFWLMMKNIFQLFFGITSSVGLNGSAIKRLTSKPEIALLTVSKAIVGSLFSRLTCASIIARVPF